MTHEENPVFYRQFLSEHQEAKELLQQIGSLIASSDSNREQLKVLFDRLSREMDRHFFYEEKALFPVLNLYRTMVLMEVEHDNLLDARDGVKRELEKTNPEAGTNSPLAEKWHHFSEALQSHILEEERGIFPLAETALEPEEQALVKRKLAEAVHLAESNPILLERPVPHFDIRQTELLKRSERPIVYKKLFEAEHASLHHLVLKAGESLSPHWAPEHQCLLVLAGEVCFIGSEGEEQRLQPGAQIILEPRYRFSLRALTEAHLLVFKIWPHPHFLRSLQ